MICIKNVSLNLCENIIDPSNTTKTNPGSDTKVLAAAIVELFLCIFGSVGNFLTCLAVFRNTTLQFATNYFIVSLAIADWLVCSILVPMRAAQHFSRRPISPIAVQIAGFIGRVNIVASISSLVALSIDRCIALRYPMRYRFSIRFATRRVLYVIVGIWVFAIFFTSLPKIPGLTDNVFLIGFIVFVLLATLVILVAYFHIFLIANEAINRRRHRRIDIVEIKVQAADPTQASGMKPTRRNEGENSASFESSQQWTRQSRLLRKEHHQDRKTAKTIGIVITAFIILVYPRIIIILYHFGAEKSSDSQLAKFWARILLYSNSVVNPILYAWQLRDFRNEFSRILCWICAKRKRREIFAGRRARGDNTTATISVSTDIESACFPRQKQGIGVGF